MNKILACRPLIVHCRKNSCRANDHFYIIDNGPVR